MTNGVYGADLIMKTHLFYHTFYVYKNLNSHIEEHVYKFPKKGNLVSVKTLGLNSFVYYVNNTFSLDSTVGTTNMSKIIFCTEIETAIEWHTHLSKLSKNQESGLS